ncbi:MAG: 50S ribosomal protein L25 [Candidatus Curtissbacteria bacterium]
MEQVPLEAQKRTVIGRKVKNLRKEGLIPAHVYGHKIETAHIQVKESDFKEVFEKVGETGIIDLSVDGAKKPVMVRGTQIHPVSDQLLHIDFYQVNLSEKVNVNVPLEIVGEAPAIEKKLGLLLTPASEIEVEALPTDLPESIEVDISNLVAVGDEIKVKDLKVDRSKVEVKTDEELVVVQIGELVTKEMEAAAAEAEAEAAAASAESTAEAAEGEEGERAEGKQDAANPPADGDETPKEDPKEDKKD